MMRDGLAGGPRSVYEEGVCPSTLRSMRQVSEAVTAIFKHLLLYKSWEGPSSEQSTLLGRGISLF